MIGIPLTGTIAGHVRLLVEYERELLKVQAISGIGAQEINEAIERLRTSFTLGTLLKMSDTTIARHLYRRISLGDSWEQAKLATHDWLEAEERKRLG